MSPQPPNLAKLVMISMTPLANRHRAEAGMKRLVRQQAVATEALDPADGGLADQACNKN
jgi:hypothetical protein